MKKSNMYAKKKNFHESNSKILRTDDTGIGIKQPVGKMRSKLQDTWVPDKKMKIPPKKLA